jgi:hypothetical protein
MSGRLRFAIGGAALTGLAGIGLLSQAAPALAASSPSAAEQFIADINALRASVGVGALRESSTLDSIASGWSLRLESAGTLSHNPSLTSEAPSSWRKLGENVGVGPSVPALQTAFTNSPEHYANMVDGSFNQIGVNVQIDSNGALWVTEDYMQAPVAVAPAPAPAVQAPTPTTVPAPVVHYAPAPVTRSAPAPTPAVRAVSSVPAATAHPVTSPPVTAAAPVTPPAAANPAISPAPTLATTPAPRPTPVVRPSRSSVMALSSPRRATVGNTASVTKTVALWVRDLSVPAALLILVAIVRRPRRHRRGTALA